MSKLEPTASSPPPKRRRGRQPRPSLLPAPLKRSVAAFAAAVGRPRVIEPAGFRDFRGWLAYISSPSAGTFWAPLVDAVYHECGGDAAKIHELKQDLVREIVKAVVIPRDGESSKLVSTNCGRQCARPKGGVTVMTILDRVLASDATYNRRIDAVSDGSSTSTAMFGSLAGGGFGEAVTTGSLPSFKELEKSINRNGLGKRSRG